MMRKALSYLFALLMLSSFSAFAGTVDVTVSNLGAGLFQYTYDLQGFNFTTNQELDFAFDASLYSNLSNDQVGADFTGTIVPPVPPPPDLPGLFEITPKVNNPSLAGTFSI